MSVIWEPSLAESDTFWQQIAVRLTRETFAARAAGLDRDQRYPWDNVGLLIEHEIAGLFVPQPYGGRGASLSATAAVVESIASGCASTAAIVCVYQLGAFPVLLAGSEDQKVAYLGELAKGTATSFALSERGAGSDAAAITTTATRTGEGWHLCGEKYWIGNGGASRYYVVFAKTDQHAGARGITAFMVDKDAPGVRIDEYADKMGLRGTLTSNLKLDVVVPDNARIGEINRGLRLALATLDPGRVLVAAQSIGVALAAYGEASGRALSRETFGRPLIEHQGIAFNLADMAVEISAARMMLYEAAKAYDAGQEISALAAMAKLFASEVAHRAVDTAVQVWGGLGLCRPSTVERIYRDQRVLEIYEGTSEIQRLIIARAIGKEGNPVIP